MARGTPISLLKLLGEIEPRLWRRRAQSMRFLVPVLPLEPPTAITGALLCFGTGAPPVISGTWARRPRHGKGSGSGSLAIFQDALGFFDVIEMAFFVADDLVVFVAFACQEHDITFLRVGEDSLDGAAAVCFDDGGFSDAQNPAIFR